MEDKKELEFLLGQWQNVPAEDPQLKHKVWTRIATEDSSSIVRYKDWLTRIPNLFSRPVPAMVFIGVCIATGILIAEIRVSSIKQIHTEELAQSYLQLIDSNQNYQKALK